MLGCTPHSSWNTELLRVLAYCFFVLIFLINCVNSNVYLKHASEHWIMAVMYFYDKINTFLILSKFLVCCVLYQWFINVYVMAIHDAFLLGWGPGRAQMSLLDLKVKKFGTPVLEEKNKCSQNNIY